MRGSIFQFVFAVVCYWNGPRLLALAHRFDWDSSWTTLFKNSAKSCAVVVRSTSVRKKGFISTVNAKGLGFSKVNTALHFNKYNTLWNTLRLMCEHEPEVLLLFFIPLNVIVLPSLYLLSVKVCLTWTYDQVISYFLSSIDFSNVPVHELGETWHLFQLNGEGFRVGHFFEEEPHRLRERDSFRMILKLIVFLWIPAHSSCCEQ